MTFPLVRNAEGSDRNEIHAMNAFAIKVAALAVAFLAAFAFAAHAESARGPQLHLVSWRIGARLYAGATLGGSTKDIHRAATRELCHPHA
jgi:hypothetical protein